MIAASTLWNQRRAHTEAEIGTVFDIGDDTAYLRWRAEKLSAYTQQITDLIVTIDDPFRLSAAEKSALVTRCRHTNMAIYQLRDPAQGNKDAVNALGRQFGLYRLDSNLCADEDSITSLRVREGGDTAEYIPYTNRALNWHTDGYYNDAQRRIRSFILHCVQDAAEGGTNGLMDHEIAYILVRDENPDYIKALLRADAMTIPANVQNGTLIRADQVGPVFLVEPHTGNLHMRYTARSRNVCWKQDSVTRQAVAFLREVLSPGSPYLVSHRLRPGQGLVSNNVLHSRSAFTDNAANSGKRLLLRARYYDRIAGTNFNEVNTREGSHAVAQ